MSPPRTTVIDAGAPAVTFEGHCGRLDLQRQTVFNNPLTIGVPVNDAHYRAYVVRDWSYFEL